MRGCSSGYTSCGGYLKLNFVVAMYIGHDSMEIGGLVSTNNLIDDGVKQVTIDSTHSLLWTMSHNLTRIVL